MDESPLPANLVHVDTVDSSGDPVENSSGSPVRRAVPGWRPTALHRRAAAGAAVDHGCDHDGPHRQSCDDAPATRMSGRHREDMPYGATCWSCECDRTVAPSRRGAPKGNPFPALWLTCADARASTCSGGTNGASTVCVARSGSLTVARAREFIHLRRTGGGGADACVQCFRRTTVRRAVRRPMSLSAGNPEFRCTRTAYARSTSRMPHARSLRRLHNRTAEATRTCRDETPRGRVGSSRQGAARARGDRPGPGPERGPARGRRRCVRVGDVAVG